MNSFNLILVQINLLYTKEQKNQLIVYWRLFNYDNLSRAVLILLAASISLSSAAA